MAGIELSLSYFGKKIIIKNETPVLHAGELYKMFKGMIVSQFGEDTWNNLTESQDEPKDYSFEEVKENLINTYGHMNWCMFMSEVIDSTQDI